MKTVTPQTIEVFTQSQNLHGLRILHLSDLHINKKTSIKQLEELVNVCNDLIYDFAVITGDIIDCKSKFLTSQLAILNSLSKTTYYISGNHDLFYGLHDLKKALSHFVYLDNKSIEITYKDKKIHLAGLSDRFSKFFNIKREENTILNRLKNSSNTILIAHQPKDYTIATRSNASLFLCGHTHGGQIFPFHYLVRLFQPFLAGLHYKKNTAIYVNRGLGTWGIDYRLKAPEEITLLKLISKSVK